MRTGSNFSTQVKRGHERQNWDDTECLSQEPHSSDIIYEDMVNSHSSLQLYNKTIVLSISHSLHQYWRLKNWIPPVAFWPVAFSITPMMTFSLSVTDWRSSSKSNSKALWRTTLNTTVTSCVYQYTNVGNEWECCITIRVCCWVQYLSIWGKWRNQIW